MKATIAVSFALLALAPHPFKPALKNVIQYTLRVDSTDLSGWDVEMRLRNTSNTFRLAMAAHPEYDDRYFRYVIGLSVEPSSAVVTRVDSAVWEVNAPKGDVRIRYRIALPSAEGPPRAAWRPFLTPTGGLVGGPHAFMYVLGDEPMPAVVALEIPRSWMIATGLPSAFPRTPGGRWSQGWQAPNGVWSRHYVARNAAELMESPILIGRLREWQFVESGVSHRIVYWPLPNATPFDTTVFVSSVQRVVHQTFALFGRAPYREYTFLFQDGAYGGLEHPNSVTLGARSETLARDPNEEIEETAHEFFHTWNLMAIKPNEYRDIDYRTQPPVHSLWFSEGLTIFYADLLLRRAGIQLDDSTRVARLERQLGRFVSNPAYARFSAESISSVAYNAQPGALGDYSAGTHLHGEVLGNMLDFIVRDATRGRRSMDDVMRALFARDSRIDGRVIERTVETVCACDVTPFFDAYIRGAAPLDYNRYLGLVGLRASVTWSPAVYNGEAERDLRIWGWEPGDGSLALVVSSPTSIWANAGLHSGDRLIGINGERITTWPALRGVLQRLRMGDTVRVAVQRPVGPFETTVRVTGFERASVRIEGTPNVIGRTWVAGTP